MKNTSWPAVALVACVLAGVIVLGTLHVDVNLVTATLPVLLGAVGYLIQQLQVVRHQTNGNTSQLLDQIKQLQDALANSVPVGVAVTPAPAVSGPPVPAEADSGPALDYTPDSQ